MQDLNDMLYFAEVVEQGGFAAAGRSLGIPKSRLSRRIAELEAQLGARLLQRTTRRIAVTDVGEAFFRHCAAMRDAARAAQDTVAALQVAPRGLVRLSCPVTLAQSVLGDALPAFLQRYPEVRIDMLVSNRPVNLLDEGIDVALRVRQTLDDSGSLVVKRLGQSRSVLVASPALLARQGTPARPEELGQLDTVAMSAVDGRSTFRLQGPQGQDFMFEHRPRYVADDLLAVRAAVLGGVGVSFLPDYLCTEGLARGQLVQVLPGWAPPPGILHAVFPSRRGLLPAVRALLDFLGELFADNKGQF